MKKLILSADSHALSSYTRCPQEYKYSHIQNLETAQSKAFFDKGTLVHLMLGLYYRLRRRGFAADKAGLLVVSKRLPRWIKLFQLSKEEELLILGRFFEYVQNYQHEDIKPIGIEVGFSEILFENRNFLFIYEGRIDWIGYEKVGNEYLLHFTDHKTRSANYGLDCFKNQFFGYAWMMRKVYGKDYKNWGKVNYFGLQADKTSKLSKDDKLFEKVWFHFTDAQIDQWEADTIFWFHRMLQSKVLNNWPRSWQCDRKFGICSFKKICNAATDWEKKLVINSPVFKRNEKAWTAWE